MGFVILVPACLVAAAVIIVNAPIALIEAFGFALSTNQKVEVAFGVMAASRTLLAAVGIPSAIIIQGGASIPRFAKIHVAAFKAFAAVVEINAKIIHCHAGLLLADGGGGKDCSS